MKYLIIIYIVFRDVFMGIACAECLCICIGCITSKDTYLTKEDLE